MIIKKMVTLLVILFLNILNPIISITLTDMKVYGGNFGFNYKFTIAGTTQQSIPSSENNIIKISFNNNIKTAKCFVDLTTASSVAIYICIYNQNIEAQNIFIIKDDENVIEINEEIEIKPFKLTINDIFAYHLEFIENNHWQFYLEGGIEKNQNEIILLDYMTYMDIKVNEDNQIAGCSIKYYTYNNVRLICKINSIEQNSNDEIKIPKIKSEINSLTFIPELEEDKPILKLNDDNKMINLEILGGYDYKNNNTYLGFKILTANKTIDFNDKKIFVVKISYFNEVKNVPCVKKDEFLYCESEKPIKLYDNIYLDIPYASGDNTENEITWTITKINSDFLYISPFLTVLYLDVYDFSYNNYYNYYEIQFKTNQTYKNNFFIVLDITINSDFTYIYCYYDESAELFKCKSKNVIEYKESDKLKFSNLPKYCESNLTTINSYLNLFHLNVLRFYDLFYDKEIFFRTYFFKIELEDDLGEENISIKFDVYIDYKGLDYAYCNINHKLLNCKIQTFHLFENIKLVNNKKGQVRFSKLGMFFEFSYVANFNRHAFSIGIKSEINLNFLQNFEFYIDYLYDNKTKIADCEISAYSSGSIHCFLLEEVDPDLIRLTNNKTKDSTITWTNRVPEDTLVFYLEAELSTINDNPYFHPNDEKWSFDVNLLNSRYDNPHVFMIDLIYNGENSTATCRYESEKKYVCIPDIEIQKNTDIFTISPEKNKGTVTLLNTMIISYARLELDLAYDLKISIGYGPPSTPYDNDADESYTVEFKIRLSESNINIGRMTEINLKCDDVINQYYSTFCTMNTSNVLICKFSGRSYTIGREFKNLRIIKDLNNKYVQWININIGDEICIHHSINITQLEFVYGHFINNIWKFYVSCGYNFYHKVNNNYSIDIYVNDNPTTALCFLEEYYLNCECTYETQRRSDIIKLRGDKNVNLGTVYFAQELTEEEKIIKPANLNINYDSIFSKLYYNGTFYFIIYFDSIDSYSYYDKLTEIEIVTFGKNDEEIITKVSCIANERYGDMICYPVIRFSKCDEIKVYVNDSGYSGNVKISPEITNRNIFIDTALGQNCTPYTHVYIPPTEALTTDYEITPEESEDTTIPTFQESLNDDLDDKSCFIYSLNKISLMLLIPKSIAKVARVPLTALG